jgi:hypothetical protein
MLNYCRAQLNRQTLALRRGLILGAALSAISVGAAPAAQTYVGNDFSPESSLLGTLESIGFEDGVPPFVILGAVRGSRQFPRRLARCPSPATIVAGGRATILLTSTSVGCSIA